MQSDGTLILNLLIMAVSGLSAAVGALVLRRITDVGREVAALVVKVQVHGESLSAGGRRFEDLERRLQEVEHEQRIILRDGCPRARARSAEPG